MLETIKDINWNEVESCFGTSEDIPANLRGIMAENKIIREGAHRDLQELLFGHGDGCEAIAYTIPFLFEILPTSNPDSQELIADLLLFPLHNTVSFEHIRIPSNQSELPPEYVALMDGVDSLIAVIGKSRPRTQYYAITILGSIYLLPTSRKREILACLIDVAEHEPDIKIRACAIYWLGWLYELAPNTLESQKQQLIDICENNWQVTDEKFSPEQFASALSLCRLKQSQTEKDVEEYLIDAIINPIWKEKSRQRNLYYAVVLIPAGVNDMDHDARLALWNLGDERVVRAIGKAIQNLEVPDNARALSVILLDRVFNLTASHRQQERQRGRSHYSTIIAVEIEKLTALQRQALIIVASSKHMKVKPTNLLEMYGLPADPDETLALLQQN